MDIIKCLRMTKFGFKHTIIQRQNYTKRREIMILDKSHEEWVEQKHAQKRIFHLISLMQQALRSKVKRRQSTGDQQACLASQLFSYWEIFLQILKKLFCSHRPLPPIMSTWWLTVEQKLSKNSIVEQIGFSGSSAFSSFSLNAKMV